MVDDRLNKLETDIGKLVNSIHELTLVSRELVIRFDNAQAESRETAERMKDLDSRLREIESVIPLVKASMSNIDKVKTGIAVMIIGAAVIGGVVGRFAP